MGVGCWTVALVANKGIGRDMAVMRVESGHVDGVHFKIEIDCGAGKVHC